MTTRNLIGLILSGALMTAVACAKEESKADKESTEAKPADPKPAEPAKEEPSAAGAVAAIDALMAPYETCRAHLAVDNGKDVAACANAMASLIEPSRGAVPEAAHPHMNAIGEAAKKLAETSAEDLDALRLAFGVVSEPMVALLTAVPDAAAKYHVFECPMAAGYKRWAQPDAKLSNPYMGTSMPGCGAEVHDHH